MRFYESKTRAGNAITFDLDRVLLINEVLHETERDDVLYVFVRFDASMGVQLAPDSYQCLKDALSDRR